MPRRICVLTFIIFVHLHRFLSLGKLTCDLDSACNGVREITSCIVTEDQPISKQDLPYPFTSGTKVSEPRCQALHSTFFPNKETHFAIQWKPPRSPYLQGFSIQIGDTLHGTRFTTYLMDLRTDQKCLNYKIQNRTFEFRCSYTGFSPRLDIILTSLPMLYTEEGSTHNPLSLYIPIKGTNQQKTHKLNGSCESSVDDYLYMIEYEKKCETKVEAVNHLAYTLGLACTAFIIVIFIVAFIVMKKKVGFLEHDGHMCQNKGNMCKQNSAKVQDGELLNNGECHWNSPGSHHTIPEDIVTTKTFYNEPLRSSSSQTSIATQDIEHSMLEINFGSPLNNLNK